MKEGIKKAASGRGKVGQGEFLKKKRQKKQDTKQQYVCEMEEPEMLIFGRSWETIQNMQQKK